MEVQTVCLAVESSGNSNTILPTVFIYFTSLVVLHIKKAKWFEFACTHSNASKIEWGFSRSNHKLCQLRNIMTYTNQESDYESAFFLLSFQTLRRNSRVPA